MYRLVRPALFRLDPERAHGFVVGALAWASRSPGARRLLSVASPSPDPRLAVDAFGLRFAHPLGLAAGMDKDGEALPAFAALGFGHVEAGSVTAVAQPGNPRPRLFRLPHDGALINRMGFNNRGAEALAARIADWRSRGALDVPVGVNVGKSKIAPLGAAAADYDASLRAVWPVADYLVVNVSSPNTPGLRSLQARAPLNELLALVADLRRELGARPTLLKVAPDLGRHELDDVVELAEAHGVAGLIATNTTLSRQGLRADPGQAGGLSGRPLAARSLEVLGHLRRSTALPLIAVGGIDGPAAAIERLAAGATLLQIYTGLVYQGPALIGRILDGLAAELDRRGLASVGELAGSPAPSGASLG